MKAELFSKDCPEAIGPYSEGIKAGDLVFTGQIGTLKTGELISEEPADQMEQCLRNAASILMEAGLTLEHVIKCTVYVTDMNDFDEINAAYCKFFSKPYPARVCIQIGKLPAGAKVEVDVIAYCK